MAVQPTRVRAAFPKQFSVRLVIFIVAVGATFLNGRELFLSLGAYPLGVWPVTWFYAFAIQISFPCILPAVWKQSRAAGLAAIFVSIVAATFTTIAVAATPAGLGESGLAKLGAAATIAIIGVVSTVLFASTFNWIAIDRSAVTPLSLPDLFHQLKASPELAPPGVDFDGETLTASQKSLAAATGTSVSGINRQIKALCSAGRLVARTAGGVTILRMEKKDDHSKSPADEHLEK